MVMPPCGTFRYAGVIPANPAAGWYLENQESIDTEDRGPLFVNRLVGLSPKVKISGGWVTLTASGRRRSQAASIAFQLGSGFTQWFQSNDILNVVRTATADIGVSLLRAGNLIAAAGAVTQVPLGEAISVHGGSNPDLRDHAFGLFSRAVDTWLDISFGSQTLRLRAGPEIIIGDYSVSVLHCFRFGIPGKYESVAISRVGTGHESSVRASEYLTTHVRITPWRPAWRFW